MNDKETYPAVLYILGDGDEGYAGGARYRLDQLDGGQYSFRNRDAAQRFCFEQGFVLISEEEMTQLRKDYGLESAP